jgi:hypothetical protein
VGGTGGEGEVVEYETWREGKRERERERKQKISPMDKLIS